MSIDFPKRSLRNRLLFTGWLVAGLFFGLVEPASGYCCEGQALGSAGSPDQRPDQRANQRLIVDLTSAVDSNDLFEPPVRLMAGGSPVAVEAPGYACPTMVDLDRDGQPDLIVGQFRGGKMMFYRNIAPPGASPRFEQGRWLMTGDRPAEVPGVS
jgi:hypothetical protein